MSESKPTYVNAKVTNRPIVLATQLEIIESAFDALRPIVLKMAETQSAFEDALSNVDFERLRRTLKVVQTFKDIELDLTPYDDVPIEQLIAAVYCARPCEYKEILDRKFLSREVSSQSHEAAGIANRVAAIFLAILKIYMYLIALGLAPDLSELRAEVTDKLVEQFNNAVEQANETQGAHYNDLHPGDVSGDQCGNNHAKAERT